MQVCPRCCLRFVQLPASHKLYSLIAPSLDQLSKALSSPSEVTPTPLSDPACPHEHESCCPACAGILQFERNSQPLSNCDAQAKVISTLDSSLPSHWQALQTLSAEGLANVVSTEGHRAFGLSMQINESGYTALRSVALWRQLQADLPDEGALKLPDFVTNCTSIKDVVKVTLSQGTADKLGCKPGEVCVPIRHGTTQSMTHISNLSIQMPVAKGRRCDRERESNAVKGFYVWSNLSTIPALQNIWK